MLMDLYGMFSPVFEEEKKESNQIKSNEKAAEI